MLRKTRKDDVALAKRRGGAGPYLAKLKQQLENPALDNSARALLQQRIKDIAAALRG